jgi:hypothetical protein
MKTEIQNESVKKLTSENGMVLTNGGEFDQYPIEIFTSINDDSWAEIVKPIKNTINYEQQNNSR